LENINSIGNELNFSNNKIFKSSDLDKKRVSFDVNNIK